MSDFVNNVVAQAINEKIISLEAENANHKGSILNNKITLEENEEKLKRILEDMEALNRYYKDVNDNIAFIKNLNKNLNWSVNENDFVVNELKSELINRTKPVPAKTRSGNLTMDTEKIIRKQFAPLLTLEGKRLDEYVVEIRTQGYDYHDTAISTALGKKSYWLGTLVQNAKQAGYRVPRNKKF